MSTTSLDFAFQSSRIQETSFQSLRTRKDEQIAPFSKNDEALSELFSESLRDTNSFSERNHANINLNFTDDSVLQEKFILVHEKIKMTLLSLISKTRVFWLLTETY